ncbi:hypothetical protein APASM_4857 [Actinosynnema pretiosum subsp. pretiosum]|nr:hypothetical protein APASM_4857 [Actinosynnema pretiosum subsp. pretiosum]
MGQGGYSFLEGCCHYPEPAGQGTSNADRAPAVPGSASPPV